MRNFYSIYKLGTGSKIKFRGVKEIEKFAKDSVAIP